MFCRRFIANIHVKVMGNVMIIGENLIRKTIGFVLMLVLTYGLCAQVAEQDSLALVALYDSTNGENWTVSENWLTGPVGSWFHAFVDILSKERRYARIDRNPMARSRRPGRGHGW